MSVLEKKKESKEEVKFKKVIKYRSLEVGCDGNIFIVECCHNNDVVKRVTQYQNYVAKVVKNPKFDVDMSVVSLGRYLIIFHKNAFIMKKDREGFVELEVFYINGEKQRVKTYRGGFLYQDIQYKDGVFHGCIREYFPETNKLYTEKLYKEGVMVIGKEWGDGGNLRFVEYGDDEDRENDYDVDSEEED